MDFERQGRVKGGGVGLIVSEYCCVSATITTWGLQTIKLLDKCYKNRWLANSGVGCLPPAMTCLRRSMFISTHY